jgi:mannose-6-phosphate isomerase-like protein (cupin superfamily)
MDAWTIDALAAARQAAGSAYLEFGRSDDLSAGLYVLAAGGTDPQQPHTEDELYHVARGSASIVVGDERIPVGPGSIVFVPALVPHRFVDIEDELVVLVVFGPAERSRSAEVVTPSGAQRGRPADPASA